MLEAPSSGIASTEHVGIVVDHRSRTILQSHYVITHDDDDEFHHDIPVNGLCIQVAIRQVQMVQRRETRSHRSVETKILRARDASQLIGVFCSRVPPRALARVEDRQWRLRWHE